MQNKVVVHVCMPGLEHQKATVSTGETEKTYPAASSEGLTPRGLVVLGPSVGRLWLQRPVASSRGYARNPQRG